MRVISPTGAELHARTSRPRASFPVLASTLCLLTLTAACDSAPLAPHEPAVVAIAVSSPSFGKAKSSVSSVTPSGTSVEVGASVQFEALDASGNIIPAQWSSNDLTRALISGEGLATGIAPGSVTVTAKTRNSSVTASLEVLASAGGTAPSPAPITACSDVPASRQVSVNSASALRTAIQEALPGDLILLADGIYEGEFKASRSGTATSPINLCGSSSAVLRGASTSSGYGFLLSGDYWVLRGITVTNSQFGVYLVGASHNLLENLTIHSVGQEAVRFRSFSSHNVLRNSRVYNTGLLNPEYGEGVYIGSWNGHWDQNSGGGPDRSDYNQVVGNVFGPDVRAEHVEAKEGTTGGQIQGNTFDGRGMVRSQSWIDSWVVVTGNEYQVTSNSGTVSIAHGFKTERQLEGWGERNLFEGNVADVQASGYGFQIRTSAPGNVVRCANDVRNASSGFANVSCAS